PVPAPKSDAPPAPAVVALQLRPEGRFALATGEALPLSVRAIDAAGAVTDVTAQATFEVRDPTAGRVDGGVFVAGPDGSRATTLLARYRDLVSNPLLVSTLAPLLATDFAAATVDGADFERDGGSLVVQLAAAAGDHVRITLPLDAPLALTN